MHLGMFGLNILVGRKFSVLGKGGNLLSEKCGIGLDLVQCLKLEVNWLPNQNLHSAHGGSLSFMMRVSGKKYF